MKLIYTLLAISLSGCAAIDTEMNHSQLNVTSKMSDSIFLEPTSPRKHIVYVSVKNTTDQDLSGIGTEIKQEFRNAGWKVTNDPDRAYNMLQVNVLQAGQAKDPDTVWKSVQSGYGALLLGGLAGVATGYLTNSTGAGIAVGALVGVGSWVADSMIKDVTYSIITDIQVSVKAKGVHQSTASNLRQGNSTIEYQSHSKTSNWQHYRARIATVADQANLKFETAKPKLIHQLAKETTGIFISQD